MKSAVNTRLNRIEAALQAISGFNKGHNPNNTPVAFLLDHLQAHPHDTDTERVLRAFDQAVAEIEAFELPGAQQTINEKLAAAVLQGDEHGQRLAFTLMTAFQNVTERRTELKQCP